MKRTLKVTQEQRGQPQRVSLSKRQEEVEVLDFQVAEEAISLAEVQVESLK